MNITKNTLKENTISIVPLIIIVYFSFVVFINNLGFYWDDWGIIWWNEMGGFDGLLACTVNDRPLFGYIYGAMFAIFGYTPIYYHILSLSLWILVSLFYYNCLMIGWSKQKIYCIASSLLLFVIPGYSLHHVSVVMVPIIISYLLELISIYLNLKIVKHNLNIWKAWRFYASIVLGLLSWYMYEAFFFMEPLRIVIVLFLVNKRDGKPAIRHSIIGALKIQYPWLVTGSVFLVWRSFYSPSNRIATSLIDHFINDPFGVLVGIYASWVDVIVYSWIYPPLAKFLSNTINIKMLSLLVLLLIFIVTLKYFIRLSDSDLNRNIAKFLCNIFRNEKKSYLPFIAVFFCAFIVIAAYSLRGGLRLPSPIPQLIISGFLAIYLYLKYLTNRTEIQKKENSWKYEWLWIGLLSSLIAVALMGAIGDYPTLNNFRDRWYLPALGGVCISISALIALLKNKNTRITILSILIGIGATYHFINSYNLSKDWSYQKSFIWQLWYRAPTIKAGSIIVLDPGEIKYRNTLKYYSLYGMFSVAYHNRDLSNQIGNAIFDGNNDTKHLRSIDSKCISKQGSRAFKFNTNWNDLLVMALGDHESCLQIASGQNHLWYGEILNSFKDIGKYSNESLIEEHRGKAPPKKIFGAPPDNWCINYQKAKLAEQFGKWNKVISIYKEAFNKKQKPGNDLELLPLAKAYYKLGKKDQTKQIIKSIPRKTERENMLIQRYLINK